MVTRLRTRIRYLCVVFLFMASTVVAFELSSDLLEYVEEEFGAPATERLQRWQHLSEMAAGAPIERQIQLVNSFFNRVNFVDDIKHWGEEDYWATPVEMLATNGGDCEDFSISKYLTLKSMGVPDAQLRIMYVKALELNQAHMVLAWYPTPDAEPLILDNLINEIRPASERSDLEPVYSFNGEGLWLNKQRGPGRRIGTPERLSRWVDLNSRLIESLR